MTDQAEMTKGRPRSQEAENRLLDAAMAVLAEEGYGGFSMDKVAARARSTKPTIYRRWRSKNDLVAAAVSRAFSKEAHGPIDTGSVVKDITRRMRRMTEVLTKTPLGKVLPDVIAETHRDFNLRDLLRRLEVDRRVLLLAELQKGIDRGELSASAPLDIIADLLLGALYLRAYIIHKPLPRSYADKIVRITLKPYLRT